MRNILVTFSGGKSSAFLSIFAKEKYKNDNLLFLFANTSKENIETLEFVNNVSNHYNIPTIWIEADVNFEKGKGTNYKVVNYDNCSKNGEVFENVIKKYGLPSKLFRHCTRELKEVIIHKYAKDYFGNNDYYTLMGIRADEKHRISNKNKYIYLLNELNIDKSFIDKWWSSQPIQLNLKDYQGNCDFCFLKSMRKKLTIAKETPNKLNWWLQMENKYSSEKQLYFDMRQKVSIADILNNSKNFNNEVKECKINNNTIFDLDIENNCYCSNI